MKNEILEVYNLGLEKYAGDVEKAKEFTIGFMKEAAFEAEAFRMTPNLVKGIGTGIGAGIAGLGLALSVGGLNSAIRGYSQSALRQRFEAALSKAIHSNPILVDADKSKVNSYAETVFKFAPNVASDPNLLSSILANAVHGEGIDSMTIRTLADLEGRVQETRKNSAFSPKAYF